MIATISNTNNTISFSNKTNLPFPDNVLNLNEVVNRN